MNTEPHCSTWEDSSGILSRFCLLIFLLLAGWLVTSCLAFEEDIQIIDTLPHQLAIVKDPNNQEADKELVQLYQDRMTPIIERCEEVYYDSTTVYTKSLRNSFNSSYQYNAITKASPDKTSEEPTFKKVELSKEQYHTYTAKCINCLRRKYASTRSKKPK